MKPPPRMKIHYGTSIYDYDEWEFGIYWGRRLNPQPGEVMYNRAFVICFHKLFRINRR